MARQGDDGILDRLIDGTRSVSRLAVLVVGAIMIGTALMVGAEVVCRKLGLFLVTGSSEVGGYMLATSSAWAFTFTLLSRSNIRFDGLYRHCPPMLRALLDLCCLLGLGLFAVLLAYYAMGVLLTSIAVGARSTSTLAVPMWMPQATWVAGLVFLCWTILLLALRVAVALVQRDFAMVTRLAGIEMAAEEVERETRDAERVVRGAPSGRDAAAELRPETDPARARPVPAKAGAEP
ncbi:MAG TPA: TRAP transporter small permease [Hyphomicrobiales bacterium]|nr:TRAP transporter small permease [Hyphomicrobiales bacterium]